MREVLIRPESADDIGAIREVNVEAFRVHPFSRQTEHLIVEALREAGALDVSLVAVHQGRVVGHIAFSDAVVGESVTGWSLMGPVAVLPAMQNEGVGSALVKTGLDELRARGATGCVLVGDPAFYGRFGFGTYPRLSHEGVPDEYVLALPFTGVKPHGSIRAHEAFEVEADVGSERAFAPEDAGPICMHLCGAACCRGPQCLRLTSAELAAFRNHAADLGLELHINESPDGAGVVRFLDHAGEHCPMLDDPTSACRIYPNRPSRCLEFPEKLRPGCALSGG